VADDRSDIAHDNEVGSRLEDFHEPGQVDHYHKVKEGRGDQTEADLIFNVAELLHHDNREKRCYGCKLAPNHKVRESQREEILVFDNILDTRSFLLFPEGKNGLVVSGDGME